MTILRYIPVESARQFHADASPIRALVGPVGSGKTSAAVWEVCYYAPRYCAQEYGIKETRWCVVRNCYSDDTEVLTDRGWVLFPELIKSDKVATLHGDRVIFETPSYYYKAPYLGEMIGLRSQNMDLLVTPEHHLYVSARRTRKKVWGEWEHKKAEDIEGSGELFRMRATADYFGNATGKSLSWFEFLGFWFAEGYVGKYPRDNASGFHYRLIVTQKPDNYVPELLSRAGLQFTICKHGESNNYVISTRGDEKKLLIEELIGYGKASTKRVPRYIIESPREYLLAFLKGYHKGDGSGGEKKKRKNQSKCYHTRSKGMADDVQEMIVRSGGSATIWHRMMKTGFHSEAVPMYCVTELTEERQSPLVMKRHWRREFYKGLVYCVEVSTHVIYVRRNGKAVWSGQTYSELIDTTKKTFLQWFPNGQWFAEEKKYLLSFPRTDDCPSFKVEVIFRSCDRPEDLKKFKSLELTGYLVDESVEVHDSIKRMLKNRIGRYPQKSPVRFGIEITNPPSIEDGTYSNFKWSPGYGPPGPMPSKKPLDGHKGWWQRPGENSANLRPGYYDDLRKDYAHVPDWIDTYIDGKPGLALKGRPVYANFSRDRHVSKVPLAWKMEEDLFGMKRGVRLVVGWDNSGNTPAAVVMQTVDVLKLQILKEYWSEKEGIIDFTLRVLKDMQDIFPGFEAVHYADPAGFNQFSAKNGGLTSNAQLQRQECGIILIPGEQNWIARQQAVEQMLARHDGILIDPSCTRLLDGFIAGYVYGEVAGRPGEYHGMPIKNKFSHIHDSFQYPVSKLFPAAIRNSPTDPFSEYMKQFPMNRSRTVDTGNDDDYDGKRW